MARLSFRLVAYFGSLLLLTAIYAAIYQWGMATLEGESRSWFHALEVVIQSMTTTGYGQDAPWETLTMTALMVAIQLTGIAYIFVAVPLFVVPWLQTIVEPTPPADVSELEDHVIVVGYTALCESLIDELESDGTEYVVLEPDEERAQSLHEAGLVVLHGDPAAAETLEDAQVGDALAVVVDASETEQIAAVIELDRRDDDPRVLALVVDPSHARYLRYAGADEVLSPKHRLGKALGDKVRPVVDADFDLEAATASADDTARADVTGRRSTADPDDPDSGDAPETADARDDGLQLVEYPIDPESDLYGEPLSDCRSIETEGVTLLGAWVRGDFLRSLSADVHVDVNTTLLLAGTADSIESVAEATGLSGSRYRPQSEPVVVAGTGTVGASVIGTLERSDVETVVLDRRDGDLVDVVGDATTETGLTGAALSDAGTLILALDDDVATLLATLVAHELEPDLEIFAAATRPENVGRLRDAGATYALGLASVAGRMLALRIFERETMTFSDRIRLRRIDVPGSTTEPLDRETIRDRTGCAVVARERDDDVSPLLEGETPEATDRLVLAGTESELEAFHEAYRGNSVD